jgi:hypothetical protein
MKVKFAPNHPHAGETGVILGAEQTLAGWGFKVKLDDCQHGAENCFLFRPTDATILPKKGAVRK